MSAQVNRNKVYFGLGTVGRDMFYTTISMYLVWFLTEVLGLSDQMLAWTGGVLTVLRIFDALNDPVMGVIVDNTNSRWGKYKPSILFGALTSAVFFILMFTDLKLSPVLYLVVFTASYLIWDITFGLNDIGYWSMLPSLSLDQKQREKIGSFAKICANVGLFVVVVGILPATGALTDLLGGNAKLAWFLFAVLVSVLMIGFQLFTVLGVKEQPGVFKQEEKTTLKDMVRVIFKNDQLLVTVAAMGLFIIGYVTTTSFGAYFFKYAFGDEGMYPIFAAVLGVSQLSALAVFPAFSRRFSRRQLYFASTLLVLAGYVLFFFSPMNMIPIGIAGVLLFVGEAFIQLMMLMFLSDTIEYGQWKLGKRNQSVTLSLQPFINKLGGAVATGIVTVTLIVSGINQAESAADVTVRGLFIMKMSMFALPLLCIIAGYFIYRLKFKIDKDFYERIVTDLKARGDIGDGE